MRLWIDWERKPNLQWHTHMLTLWPWRDLDFDHLISKLHHNVQVTRGIASFWHSRAFHSWINWERETDRLTDRRRRESVTDTHLDVCHVSAFDVVNHNLLFDKLHNTHGIPNCLLKWIGSYLSNSQQRVRANQITISLKAT